MTDIWHFEMAVRTLYQEASGEPDEGKRAVAHVLWNRHRSGRWGGTLAEVVLQPLQFSGWNTKDPNRLRTAKVADADPLLSKCRAIMQAAENEPDPTGGAMFYYAPAAMKAMKKPPPPWAAKMAPCGKFGNQLFFKEKTK